MKLSLSATTVKSAWQNNKPFLVFLLCLLLMHSVLKIIFYYYNHSLLSVGTAKSGTAALLKWSLAYDLLTLLMINTGLLLLLQVCRLLKITTAGWLVTVAFAAINTSALFLNILDLFYFRFRFQRASADLLYVTRHSFNQVFHFNLPVIMFILLAVAAFTGIVWMLHRNLYRSFLQNRRHILMTIVLLTSLSVLLFFNSRFSKFLLPAYPLVEIQGAELPGVQNSFHTFAYSVFRGGGVIPVPRYFTDAFCDSLFPLRKSIQPYAAAASKKNVVLFIMESIPFDFFDSASRFKVRMPFFDSLIQKSRFFQNAFCFSHESNKGITAILAGIPTLTDIPVYHSPAVTMPVTAAGKAIKQDKYGSFFCIGDAYDNFGFAKCMNWLGIDNYYSKEDIPGYKKLPAHPMGLHDENVLPFFYRKLNEQTAPFLGIHYNVSTHYPYDLPGTYTKKFPGDYTLPMRSMEYYDHCLQQFFAGASEQDWFKETIFIFCSDHWMFPEGIEGTYDPVGGYRIPLIIFDPADNKQVTKKEVVSQFDVLGTVLAAAGCKDSIISYGGNLFDSASLKGLAFSKVNSSLYQVTDSTHVLGFNVSTNKVEYLYNYKKDRKLKQNLAENKDASRVQEALAVQIRAFIQKAGLHYSGIPVK